ncbi:Inner membrane protein translocase and chaperone YidC, long form [hydrothermal vent metagenome]|uniref:Membrane protein insertase YidC n=1 Tax=hydrothermal vent metagenome TaxID=652676 RepID=A0A3B0T3B9_9ZZZZ
MNEQRNFILAISLSMIVLVGWQFFVGIPRIEQQQAAQQTLAEEAGTQGSAPVPGAVPVPGGAPTTIEAQETIREAVVSIAPRIVIDTPRVDGSISLLGARLDDLKLKDYRETVDPESPEITLLSPSGSPSPYYVEQGWTVAPGEVAPVPDATTVWSREGTGILAPETPVVLTYDNGQGLKFRRTIAVDDNYMFTVTQSVKNAGNTSVTLYPYALISRHGLPEIENFFILHEGFVGVLGEEGLQEIDYDDVIDDGPQSFEATNGWLGITDKYWATVIAPEQGQPYSARYSAAGTRPVFQADYLLEAVTIAPSATASVTSNVFAGAKRVELLNAYKDDLNLLNFNLLIDWGWFYFITQPLFTLIDFLFRYFGNFGMAILATTVLIKLALFPLANKSYVSMSKMKKLQPEMTKLRERFGDDRAKQQQAMMELYKKEKVNPMSGCLPIVVQIPIFFALYKTLFVTIEMRHQPFFGWIKDLSAPDPTSLFNLFGLIPWDPPTFLIVGAWPIIMGVTMFVQMRLNPTPPDPVQAQIFTWMPLLFTFLLANFASGLVIYWAWNNFLSILQQYFIMTRQGVEVNLFGNIMEAFGKKVAAAANVSGTPEASAEPGASAEKAENSAKKPNASTGKASDTTKKAKSPPKKPKAAPKQKPPSKSARKPVKNPARKPRKRPVKKP